MQTASRMEVFPRAFGPMMKFVPGANSVSHCSKQRKWRNLMRVTAGKPDPGTSALIGRRAAQADNSGRSQLQKLAGGPDVRQAAACSKRREAGSLRPDMQTLPGFREFY